MSENTQPDKNQFEVPLAANQAPNMPPMYNPNYGFQPPVNQPYGFQPPPSYDQSNPKTDLSQQQQQFYPQQQAPQVITVITANTMGSEPRAITCPSCRNLITSRVDYQNSSRTHLMALLVCLLCWPCFWIPYAVDSCKTATHYCPSCNAYLGSHEA